MSFEEENLNIIYKESIENCIFCNSFNIDSDLETGYVVCVDCGSILNTIISEDVDFSESNQTDSTNPFSPVLSTYLPKGSNSYILKNNEYIKCDIYKLHVQNSYNNLQKSYDQVTSVIDNITTLSDSIKDLSKKLWSIVMKSGLVIRSGPRKGLIACCIYYSCIYYDVPRSPLEICIELGLSDTKNFNKGLKEFRSIFEQTEYKHLLTKSTTAMDYFVRLCSDMSIAKIIQENISFQLSQKCINKYEDIKLKIEESIFPKNLACSIIYIVCRQENIALTKIKLSKCLNICYPTLCKTIKLLEIYI